MKMRKSSESKLADSEFARSGNLLVYSLQELLAIRKLQRLRQGIDAVKLNQGAPRKKRIQPPEEPTYGLQPRKGDTHQDDEE